MGFQAGSRSRVKYSARKRVVGLSRSLPEIGEQGTEKEWIAQLRARPGGYLGPEKLNSAPFIAEAGSPHPLGHSERTYNGPRGPCRTSTRTITIRDFSQ